MSHIKISSFNVNSVNARLPNILAWLKISNSDIILLQEIKCLEKDFPKEVFFDIGYNTAVLGQKSYNGVAILSKFKIEEVITTLPGLDSKNSFGDVKLDQARYIEALIPVHDKVLRLASIYVPNGGGEISFNQTLETSDKFRYKLNFFDAIASHFEKLLTYDEIAIFGGDYNVAAENIDVYDAKNLDGTICFHELERQKLRSLLNLGLTDSYRAFNQEKQEFSWWDYRGGSWQYNKGMRIDYLLTSPYATDKIIAANIESKGVRDAIKASDHCPVSVILEI